MAEEEGYTGEETVTHVVTAFEHAVEVRAKDHSFLSLSAGYDLDFSVIQEFLRLTPEAKNRRYKAPLHEFLTRHGYPFEACRLRLLGVSSAAGWSSV